MKRTILQALIALLCSISYAQPCNTLHLTFINQEGVNTFRQAYPGCTIIEGDVYISGSIDNIDSLWPIQSIGGSLTINNNTSLTSINGLNNLENVGGYIRIQHNEKLASLKGLEKLQKLPGDFFYISNNPEITSLVPLSGIDSIMGIFQIYEMPHLINLKGLDSLKYVGNDFKLFKMERLSSLIGIEKLKQIQGSFSIYQNDSLSDLSSLNDELRLENQMFIYENPMLELCSTPFLCSLAINFPEKLLVQQNGSNCSNIETLRELCLLNNEEITSTSSFFPNPFHQALYTHDKKDRIIQIFDLSCKFMAKLPVVGGSIDTSPLPSGGFLIIDNNKTHLLFKK